MVNKTNDETQQRTERSEDQRLSDGESTGRSLDIRIPLPSAKQVATGAVNTALLPIAVARDVLPAKGGLPLYIGLGVLGATEVLEWPVAVGIGVGYAILRRGRSVEQPARTAEAA